MINKSADEYLWLLYTYLREDRPYQDRFTPAYVVAASDQVGHGKRIKIVILARDRRYICFWQPRKAFGPMRLCKVHRRSQPYVYSYARANIGRKGQTAEGSLELAGLFLNILGEGITESREAG